MISLRTYFFLFLVCGLTCAFWHHFVRVQTYVIFADFGEETAPDLKTRVFLRDLEIGFIGDQEKGNGFTEVHLYDWAYVCSTDLLFFSPNTNGRVEVISTSDYSCKTVMAESQTFIRGVVVQSDNLTADKFLMMLYQNNFKGFEEQLEILPAFLRNTEQNKKRVSGTETENDALKTESKSPE